VINGEKKEKKKIARLDEARLLGPDGFPALVKQTKHWKPKGKGHEVLMILSPMSSTFNNRGLSESSQISILCYKSTNSGLTRCTLRHISGIPSKQWRNFATVRGCM
jgi:hypothetical protein